MKFKTIFINILFSFGLLWLCFVMAWQLLSWQNFHYAYWYEKLSIQEHIQNYAAKNIKGKQNFSLTSAVQHQALFQDVLNSVNNSGHGLADIYYEVPSDRQVYQLFTRAEIIHLQDVANLIDFMANLTGVVLLAFVLVLVMICRKTITLLPMKNHLLYGLGVVVFSVVAILLIGAKNVFYWLHIKIFPDGHQWFFFYQESLMSTFMKAPILFAPMAITWLVTALFLWAIIFLFISQLLKRFCYD